MLPLIRLYAQTRLLLDPSAGISTLAGNGRDARTVEGAAPDVALGSPRGLVYDSAGNLYLADSRNHQIDRITPEGVLTVFAGTGSQGHEGDGGPAVAAELNTPTALALGSNGALFVADSGNHCIRRIANGTISTFAGNGTAGFKGDGGIAVAGQLRSPAGLAFGPDGSLYIADTGNHRIRKVDARGLLSTVAGSGAEDDTGNGGPATAAAFRAPGSLQMLPDGRLLIADREAHRLRALLPDGTVSAYLTAALSKPEGLGTDPAGNLLIADADKQQVLLSGPDASGNTAVSSLAGSGVQGVATVGAATASALDAPAAATADVNGNIAISDRRNHRIQRVALASLAFGNVPAGRVSAPQSLTVTNGSELELTVSAVQMPSGFITTSGGTCAAAPFTLQPAGSCGIGIAFSPIAQGQHRAFLQMKLVSAPAATVVLTGTGTAPGSLSPSITTLTTNGGISYAGTPVQFTSAVSGTLETPPVGNVTFFDGAAPLATVALSAGSASLTTAGMQTGQHRVRAAYSGDAVYAASTSGDTTQTVVAAPDFTISAADSSYSGKAGGGFSIPMSVLPVNGTLNHTVRLTIGGLPAGATALFTPSIFTLGGDPTNVSLVITMPATLSRSSPPNQSFTLACCLAGILLNVPLGRVRNRASAARAVMMLVLGVAAGICSGGCGGGFRGPTASTGTGTSKTFAYTAVITAASTGVLGDVLTHTATVGLVVAQ